MIERVKELFQTLQNEICDALAGMDGESEFSKEIISGANGSRSLPRVLSGAGALEKAAVNYTYSIGDSLPASASERNPEFQGKPFRAVSISLIVHPNNPFVPTTHMNLRFFLIGSPPIVWHFGGGYDLTPTYGFEEDAIFWHKGARDASRDYYGEMKKNCDDYFYLPHRKEQRGIGGLFFDDFRSDNFEGTFDIVERIGKSFLPLYQEIFYRRQNTPFSEENRAFQLYRRGRYAEFNLIYDRGTRYGLQSGRRIESVLASMPPLASWVYDYEIARDSPEHRLTEFFLKPRKWVT